MNQGAKVLVVDDEESIRYTLKFFLEEAGHRVTLAREYKEALACLAETRFQVAVVDQDLAQGQNGLALVHQLKNLQPECVGIVITAQPSLKKAMLAMRWEVFAYLVKPVEAEEIRHLVAQALRCADYDKQLREQLHRLMALVDGSPHPILVRDLQGGPLYFNAAFHKRFGYGPEDLAQGLEPFVPPWDRERTRGDIQALLKGGTALERDTLRLSRDGRLLHVAMTITLGRDTAGRARELLFVFRDNSRVARLESHIRHMEKMAALGEMAGGMAHEFNNYLTAISGFAQLGLLQPSPGDPRHSHLDKIDRLTQRARVMVKRILTYSRRSQAQDHYISLAPVLREGLELLKETLPANIEIEQHIQESEATVAAEDIQIHQILDNLCHNAAHAMEQGGRLTVVLREREIKEVRNGSWSGLPAGLYQQLTVKDTGHGMEPEVQKRIFEAFYTTKDSESGTGLGLALVRGLVRELGGAIAVESQPGRGTTFRVLLPCRRYDQATALISGNQDQVACAASTRRLK